MDDFEDDYKSAIEAGQRNLRATKLLRNWCFHAEVARSPGRGMIEAETGLPIGHMGVECKFSKKSSMMCWFLEDGAYDFYQNNCKDCKERVPVGIPNIMDFVAPREKAAEQRKRVREKGERERKQKQTDRQNERARLRSELSLEENFVLDLLDDLDQVGIAVDDPRLEQLADLAPEVFTRKVIDHLLPAVLDEYLPYSMPAAKALLRASLEPEEKLSVAVRLIDRHECSTAAIDVVLSNAEKISQHDLIEILHHFVSMALGPPPGMYLGDKPIRRDATPINILFQKRHDDICDEVDVLLSSTDSSAKIGAAVAILLATDSDELLSRHTRGIFSKLMRRRALLPEEHRDSTTLYYLREAASKCLERYPEDTDRIIQSLLVGSDETGREEASRAYGSVLKHRFREKVQIGEAQRIAFRRLLWAAVELPEKRMDDAGQFFMHTWDEFSELAVEHFEDLIGAAATLSGKYEQVGTDSTLEMIDDVLSEMARNNKRLAIDSLQKSLIKWAAIGARSKGHAGIEEFLDLYRRLPQDQTQMRGNMITHVSKLLTGVESLALVLPDWYGALLDESTLVRANAVRAWEDVPHDLVKNFPDLFFEAYSVLLTDPYIIVHQSAVHALQYRSFPEEKRSLIKQQLWNLIFYYSQKSKQEDFVVDCISAFAYFCLSPEERKGELGRLLSAILLNLEGSALYHAVNQLHYGFEGVPGFTKVALKSIQDDYTRRISIDDCMSAILRASHSELLNCVDDIKTAFSDLKPFRPESFIEALLYAAVLTRAGKYKDVSVDFKKLKASIPAEDRYKQWYLEVAVVETAAEIEHKIENREELDELAEKWNSLLIDLEKEYEERAKFRDFPPSFFLEG